MELVAGADARERLSAFAFKGGGGLFYFYATRVVAGMGIGGGRRAGAYFVASFMLRTISKGAER